MTDPWEDLALARGREIERLKISLAFIALRARSDGTRTFDGCIRELEWIDDECRGQWPTRAGKSVLRWHGWHRGKTRTLKLEHFPLTLHRNLRRRGNLRILAE
jgi:hypothetical protein